MWTFHNVKRESPNHASTLQPQVPYGFVNCEVERKIDMIAIASS